MSRTCDPSHACTLVAGPARPREPVHRTPMGTGTGSWLRGCALALVIGLGLTSGCASGRTARAAEPPAYGAALPSQAPRTVYAAPAPDAVVVVDSTFDPRAAADPQAVIGMETLSDGTQVKVVTYVHTYPEPIETYPRVRWSGRWYYNVNGDFVYWSDYYGGWVYYWGAPGPLVGAWNFYYPWAPYAWGVGFYGPGWYWGGVGFWGFHAYGVPVNHVHHHHHHYYGHGTLPADRGGRPATGGRPPATETTATRVPPPRGSAAPDRSPPPRDVPGRQPPPREVPGPQAPADALAAAPPDRSPPPRVRPVAPTTQGPTGVALAPMDRQAPPRTVAATPASEATWRTPPVRTRPPTSNPVPAWGAGGNGPATPSATPSFRNPAQTSPGGASPSRSAPPRAPSTSPSTPPPSYRNPSTPPPSYRSPSAPPPSRSAPSYRAPSSAPSPSRAAPPRSSSPPRSAPPRSSSPPRSAPMRSAPSRGGRSPRG